MSSQALITGTLPFCPRVGVLVGQFAELQRVVTAADVSAYAALLGDSNPLHTDAAFAATTPWKRPIAHGMISAGLIPTIFGATIPSSVYVSQTLRFTRPVFVGDTVRARVEVRAVAARKIGGGTVHQFATCATTVTLEDGGLVAVDGEAVAMMPALADGDAQP